MARRSVTAPVDQRVRPARHSYSRTGRFEPTRAQVRIVRRGRHDDGTSFEELAAEFNAHAKTIERVCRGLDHPDTGGPIEEGTGQTRIADPFDARLLVRCPECGGLVHPPCFKCALAISADPPACE